MLHGATARSRLAIAWISGSAVALAGLGISYREDLSTGATLVCAYGAALALAGLARVRRDRLLAGLRWGAAAALFASAAWVIVLPRADQPLLDLLERMYPALRALYMDEKSLAQAADAESYEARYRVESEKLRAREAERRWSGEPLEEAEVRKIAAFLKSYNEMIAGERFVVREVRSRARAAQRAWIGAVFLLVAALVLPWRPRRWNSPAQPRSKGP